MTVAILCPTHNRADTLPDMIESCLRQTDPDWRLYVLNDGSTDDTAARRVAGEWNDERIAFSPQNKNPANEPGVRNALFHLWEVWRPDDFACWLDSDDTMHPDRIKHQREYMEAHPDLDLCFCDIGVMRDGIVEDFIGVDPALFGRSLEGYRTLVSPSAMFRPSVRAVPFDERMIHGGCDKLWLFTLVQRGLKIGTLREPLYYLREHPGRLTRQREHMPKESLKADLDHFYAEIERMGGTR